MLPINASSLAYANLKIIHPQYASLSHSNLFWLGLSEKKFFFKTAQTPTFRKPILSLASINVCTGYFDHHFS